LRGLAGEEALHPTFEEALETERVMDALQRSAAASAWIEL
jgi:hypothetical protein